MPWRLRNLCHITRHRRCACPVLSNKSYLCNMSHTTGLYWERGRFRVRWTFATPAVLPHHSRTHPNAIIPFLSLRSSFTNTSHDWNLSTPANCREVSHQLSVSGATFFFGVQKAFFLGYNLPQRWCLFRDTIFWDTKRFFFWDTDAFWEIQKGFFSIQKRRFGGYKRLFLTRKKEKKQNNFPCPSPLRHTSPHFKVC